MIDWILPIVAFAAIIGTPIGWALGGRSVERVGAPTPDPRDADPLQVAILEVELEICDLNAEPLWAPTRRHGYDFDKEWRNRDTKACLRHAAGGRYRLVEGGASDD